MFRFWDNFEISASPKKNKTIELNGIRICQNKDVLHNWISPRFLSLSPSTIKFSKLKLNAERLPCACFSWVNIITVWSNCCICDMTVCPVWSKHLEKCLGNKFDNVQKARDYSLKQLFYRWLRFSEFEKFLQLFKPFFTFMCEIILGDSHDPFHIGW